MFENAFQLQDDRKRSIIVELIKKSNNIRLRVIDSLDAPYEFLSNEHFVNTGYTIANDFYRIDQHILKNSENT